MIKNKNVLYKYIDEDTISNGICKGFSYFIKLIYGNVAAMDNHCIVNSGVAIGDKGPGFNILKPIVGENVDFCVDSIAIGDIHIGDNVMVTSNAVVTKDVPSDCVVRGIPSIIIKGEIKH